MEAAYWVWDVLIAAGSMAALSFVVLMALALNALTVFYLGSAIVVLDRFARVARSRGWLVIFAAVAILSASALVMRGQSQELGATSPGDWPAR